MITRATAVLALIALIAAACAGSVSDSTSTSTDTTTSTDGIILGFDFLNGSDGWAAEVADYTDATRPEDVLAATGVQPPGIEEGDGFFHLAGTNRSDDMFHYMFRELGPADGLSPNTNYQVGFSVRFASNAPSGCAGVGGAPGESVWMKVGVSDVQPVPIEDDGYTGLRIDKGNQASGGEDAEVAGVIANGIPCEEALEQDETPYAMVDLDHQLSGSVTSSEDGTLWALVGIDSGFESRTSIYYDRVIITFTPTDS